MNFSFWPSIWFGLPGRLRILGLRFWNRSIRDSRFCAAKVWSTPGELDSAARSANATDIANFGFLIGATWEYGGEVHMEIEQTIRAERMRNIGSPSAKVAKSCDSVFLV